MLFEVLFDGKVRASTSYLECIPTKNTLPDMEHASDLFTCDRLTGSTAGKNMFYNCNSLVGGNGTKYADISISSAPMWIETTFTPTSFSIR